MAQIQQGQFNRHRIRHSPQLFSAIDNLSAVAEPLSTPKDLPIGERGIVNMGQTCFIGCVLQVGVIKIFGFVLQHLFVNDHVLHLPRCLHLRFALQL
mmetsp:Transcript_5421/g.12253  ORF Transcript_5421/g.12253 Transcript_5421/m.12253 type:complete len:97 (+) Transcript_5421:151-441(+)